MKIIYNGTQIDKEEGKAVDIFAREIQNAQYEIMACMINNEVKSLNTQIKENDKIELIDMTHRDGRRIYIRGVLFTMSKAFHNIYPQALLSVDYQLSDAMYCEIDNMEITDEMMTKVKKEMQRIVEEDLEIRKVVMTKNEAETFYEQEKTLKGRLQMENMQKDSVSLYYCEDYYNYFYGVMPVTTGELKYFDIMKYYNGFLVRYPSKITPREIGEYKEGKKFLATLEEYEKIYELLKINTIYNLNKKIKEEKLSDVILLSEALHEKKISDIADQIASHKGMKLVLIAGPSSSGKTTFAKRLGVQLRLNGLKPVTIGTDNYFVERVDNPKDEFGNYDFETIDALDLPLFNDHLQKLIAGETVEVPTFDFKTGTKHYTGKTLSLADDEILVIEGIHCLNDKLTSAIPKENKYKIYISDLTVLNVDYYNRISTTDTRLIRRIVRDHQFRGYSAEDTLAKWYSVRAGEDKNIFPYQEEADIMFNSSLVYELAVLKDYAIPLLDEIDSSKPEYAEAKRLKEFLKYFESIPEEHIPNNSLLKEFIGDSIFED